MLYCALISKTIMATHVILLGKVQAFVWIVSNPETDFRVKEGFMGSTDGYSYYGLL